MTATLLRALTVGVILTTGLQALDVGDQAPGLDAATWIKGEAPAAGTGITVVEFWATWCPPCRTSIPHLTSLQQRFGEAVTIIGLSNEDRATVAPFVDQQGASMDYVVGLLDGSARDAWMADVRGIPYAYVVTADGTIAWEGHPMQLDPVLEGLVSGTLNPAQLAEIGALEAQLQQAAQANDMAGAISASDALLALNPAHPMGLGIRAQIAKIQGDTATHRQLFQALVEQPVAPVTAAQVAASLLGEAELQWRHLDLAIAILEPAAEAAADDASVLTTWAHANYLIGKLDEAIALQQQAIAIAGATTELSAGLSYYQQAKALATP